MQHIHKINIKYVDFTINRRLLEFFNDFSPVPTSIVSLFLGASRRGLKFLPQTTKYVF